MRITTFALGLFLVSACFVRVDYTDTGGDTTVSEFRRVDGVLDPSSERVLLEGIELHQIDGVNIRIYSAEKTLADCFKFRNKIGMDIVLEALKLYKSRKTFQLDELLKYAKICRVENIMRPYLEMALER